ncbi:PREDICTED: glucagon-like peptide 2 receptor [Nanorana parkeri]|uniref:glucagon-like peptide 2 receptor n=1 Tax=Nanorana parkeri TaxID=125878 RepID=UPI000854C857|nr:PREDICTED: glucagon-like peptide 2 receptor [Nanorana parkeri]
MELNDELLHIPPLTGVYCNGVFDLYACWPFSPPGNVSVACPWYLPKKDRGSGGFAHRLCTDNGTWQTDGNRSEIWRDVSECPSLITELHVGRDHSQVGRDRSQVGRDRSQVGRDRSQVGRDRSQVGRDRSQVGRDRSQVGRDRSQVGRDRSQVGRDRSQVGRDRSQVGRDRSQVGRDRSQPMPTPFLKICYTIGYSISLGTLLVALCILLAFRKLHCMRNFIHINLFTSFILRAIAVLVKDTVENASLMEPTPTDEEGWRSKHCFQVPSSCRVVYVALHYFIGANFFWLLVEGIYLYTTIVTVLLSERRMLIRYIAIGWSCPLLFIVPWAIARLYLENDTCWKTNSSTGIWYIIKGPMLLCVFVNFIVHIRILHLLRLKLKAQQMKFTDYKYRFAKATLILIPLLGTHEVFFTFVSDEHIKGLTKDILLFIQLTLSSFQGFVVAYLYCFTNGEVKAELRKQWNLFLLQYFPCRSCVFRGQVKHKTQSAKKNKNALFSHDGIYPNGKKKREVHLLPPPGILTSDLDPQHSAALQYFARGSVSESSDGGLTMGETIEETVEESEIC